MPERPLVLFAQPATADKEKMSSGPSNFHKPTFAQQKSLISPQFAVLQRAFENGNARMTSSANAVEPEYTIVFETVGNPSEFYTAVNKLKTKYPNVEWLMELSSTCPNNNEFYAIDKKGNRDDTKQLKTKVFCILTNQQALSQILSLWKNYSSNEQFKFESGLTGFKHLFSTLKDVHQWGIQERIEDTGLLEEWNEELKYNPNNTVRTQIELFYRSSEYKRNSSEQRITNLITSVGGTVISRSLIPEIQYHAILAEIPKAYAQRILGREEVELVLADEIMFMKGTGQTIMVGLSEETDEFASLSAPTRIIKEPIIALFDGMPQENHPLLSNLLLVDDPDSLSSNYPVDERIHGTSMASLILRGQTMNSIKEDIHRIYVRPIMKSQKDWRDIIEEFIPDDFLIVDKIHECVRRLFEPVAGKVAPSVRVINLSIGISYREYYNLISPLARLLDWLSYKYRVLFIVSAGNHSSDMELGMDFSTYAALPNDKKNKFVYNYISDNIRRLRFLSPAESMNSLTIGSIFSDNNDGTPLYNMTNLCADNVPSMYGSYGRGINNAVKPDILYPGGRSFIREDVAKREKAKWVVSNTRKPGIQSAYPNISRQGLGAIGYTFGTSNSAALISNKAAECYDVLNGVFISETGESVPYDYVAVILKAMLAHGASLSELQDDCIDYLSLSGRQIKSDIHKIGGYGVADVEKVKECTKNQITLIGYGDIKQNQAFLYSIPLPFNFHTQKYKRKLTVTLAYFSPIHPSSIKYREKQVWFTLDNGKNIAGKRAEYDYKAVLRGTLQHEIFEAESIQVWDENNSLTIKVNCRGDASDSDADVLIPYALFATFEMAPEYNIDVYQTVVDKVRAKNIIAPNT